MDQTPSRPMPSPPPSLFSSSALSSAPLIDSLLHASTELSSISPLPYLQTRNTSAALHRFHLLSFLFQELRDSAPPLSPSTILCLTELYSILHRTKSLFLDLATGSSLWSLLHLHANANSFHSCTRDLASALDILPLNLLPISPDLYEQLSLLHRLANRSPLFIDPRDLLLHQDLLTIMLQNPNNPPPTNLPKFIHIMRTIGLNSHSSYKQEIFRLQLEITNQAGTGGVIAITNITNLISLISHAKSSLSKPTKSNLSPPPPPQNLTQSLPNSSPFTIPTQFLCPITHNLIKDPVIISSGHTYDRISISKWINSGHQTCPKTGHKLIHMALIPNYALKSLIEHWCKEHNFKISHPQTSTKIFEKTADFLVGKLAIGSSQTQRQAAYELRLLAKTSMENRTIIVEAGAIPFLITLLSSKDPLTQQNAVTVLLNLSISNNNKILIMSAGAINPIIRVLVSGKTMEARENSAATIFSLSMLYEYKVEIGGKGQVFSGLVGLLREGTNLGKKDAILAMFSLAIYGGNKVGIVEAGTVELICKVLMDEEVGVTDDAIALLALLVGCEEGMKRIRESGVVERVLVELLRFGSEKGKENCVVVLLGLFGGGGDEMGRRLLKSVDLIHGLVESGSPRGKRKAEALLRLIDRCMKDGFGDV